MSSMTDEHHDGRAYWRSLDDLADKPEFRELVRREFPLFADEMLAPSRRDFLKLMGASVALAGLTGCRRWPAELLVPFAHRPEGYVPGVPVQYATSMEIGGSVQGLLVTAYDGRPIKVDGNPMHPASLGGTDHLAQASVLQMYDPDREVRVSERQGEVFVERGWDAFLAHALPTMREHKADGGRGLRVLCEASSSPSLADLKARFLAAYPNASWHTWEPLNRDQEREGARLAFGRAVRTHYALAEAEVVLALDADLLMAHPDGVRYARHWGSRRSAAGGSMNRLYAVESVYSLTGGVADVRIPVQARMVAVVAGKVAAALLKAGVALPESLQSIRPAIDAFGRNAFTDPAIEKIAADLAANRGRSIVAAGPRQPAVVHALAHAINAMLGNAGTTVRYTEDPEGDRPAHAASLGALTAAIGNGGVKTLILLGGNPVFDAPADAGLPAALGKVRETWRLGDYLDETSEVCSWHLPKAHYLEAWSDLRSWDGTWGVTQPVLEPLYDGRTAAETLALLLEEPTAKGYDLVRRSLGGALGTPDFEPRWRQVLHDGIVADSAFPAIVPEITAAAWSSELAAAAGTTAVEGSKLEVVFERSIPVHDGRFANLGWLQEMPEPFTKTTWDNPAIVGPATAKALGVGTGDVVKVTVDGRSIEIPVFVLPGTAANTIVLHTGWGRRRAGRVGTGRGFDVYPVRSAASSWFGVAEVAGTGATYDIVSVQDHHVVDDLGKTERDRRALHLVREADLDYFREHPDFAQHMVHVPGDIQLWSPHAYEGYKWGMTIDLSSCIGCGACAVACYAENNIPVVGKAEVRRGREMSWLRIDRYFQGSPDRPHSLAFQPMTCHHCENAPCEQVCPVAATVHDQEGLNVMVYNRCIGTRYCSNNCPYKVRRFNYFNNHKHPNAIESMVYNPEVTVRSRGVMEKCTFCIQRIEGAKIRAKNDQRRVQDGEIVTACQQACPTQAIVFGDLNDEGSRVAAAFGDKRSYGVLEEINTKPRLKYMARLKNRPEGFTVEPPTSGHGGGHHGSEA
ncbi:MAG TPA: TAT-variant-translocated molybdopterin oxidoreductase [Candidatus Polarisedimenticolaceae bacterium]